MAEKTAARPSLASSSRNSQNPRNPPNLPHHVEVEDTEHDGDILPGYSGPSTSVATGPGPQQSYISIPGIVPIDFKKYLIPGSTLSNDQVTIVISLPNLLNDPRALTKFISDQASLPPKPQVRIFGSHTEHGSRKVDFDIRLNMLRYIVRPPNSTWNYVKLDATVSHTTVDGGIAAWATRFCRDQAANKSFTLQREVLNWNTHLLDGRLRSLVASLRYQGRVSITFPITHSKVVVQPSTTFYSRIISLVKETNRYEVVRSLWPYADVAGDVENSENRTCAVQTESSWWSDWKDMVTCAILDKRQGWITLDDLMELAMTPARELQAQRDWGIDS